MKTLIVASFLLVPAFAQAQERFTAEQRDNYRIFAKTWAIGKEDAEAAIDFLAYDSQVRKVKEPAPYMGGR